MGTFNSRRPTSCDAHAFMYTHALGENHQINVQFFSASLHMQSADSSAQVATLTYAMCGFVCTRKHARICKVRFCVFCTFTPKLARTHLSTHTCTQHKFRNNYTCTRSGHMHAEPMLAKEYTQASTRESTNATNARKHARGNTRTQTVQKMGAKTQAKRLV